MNISPFSSFKVQDYMPSPIIIYLPVVLSEDLSGTSACDASLKSPLKPVNLPDKEDRLFKKYKRTFSRKMRWNWNLIEIEAREGFVRSTESQIKWSAGLNMHDEKIKLIYKSNNHACCPSYESKETWENVLLCEKLKDKR